MGFASNFSHSVGVCSFSMVKRHNNNFNFLWRQLREKNVTKHVLKLDKLIADKIAAYKTLNNYRGTFIVPIINVIFEKLIKKSGDLMQHSQNIPTEDRRKNQNTTIQIQK